MYVKVSSKMELSLIVFIDETGDEGYDMWDGNHKDILEKYDNRLHKVKEFKDLKIPEKMEK